jgi:hypothetical protein
MSPLRQLIDEIRRRSLSQVRAEHAALTAN